MEFKKPMSLFLHRNNDIAFSVCTQALTDDAPVWYFHTGLFFC